MQEINNIVRHGDVDIIPIGMTSLKSIPKEAIQQKDNVVMHGESGHSHRIQSGQILVMPESIEVETSSGTKQVEKFLHIPETTTISHEEHLTKPILNGDYIVLQEREMDHIAEVERTVMD